MSQVFRSHLRKLHSIGLDHHRHGTMASDRPVVLVTGGRLFTNYEAVCRELDKLEPGKIVEGGAAGADTLARRYARERGIELATHRANWNRYGLGAGPKRNQLMLDVESPHIVLAFPGMSGTADMVARAKRGGYRVIEVNA